MVGTNGSDARASPTVLRRRGRSPLSTCWCSSRELVSCAHWVVPNAYHDA
jgi:hypothetical protein